jgi:RNA polymerase sigma-70 factor, ECF subfamily
VAQQVFGTVLSLINGAQEGHPTGSKRGRKMAGIIEEAWVALHEPLHAFFRKHVLDEATAEDLLQEVFLGIHTHADQLRETDKLESWIYQLARHQLIDYYQSNKPAYSLEVVDPEAVAAELPEPDIRGELARSVARMVYLLPAPEREALLLTDYRGLTQRELATRLGLSVSGAKSRVERARRRLKQLLWDCSHFAFDRLGRVIDYHPHCACCRSGACQSQRATHESPLAR